MGLDLAQWESPRFETVPKIFKSPNSEHPNSNICLKLASSQKTKISMIGTYMIYIYDTNSHMHDYKREKKKDNT